VFLSRRPFPQDRSPQIAKAQAELAVHVTRFVGRPGSSVLIFVAGMAEIVDLVDRFEALNESAMNGTGGGGGKKVLYKIVAIHSDIPDDEQAEAFVAAGASVVKVVVATNAAESSITLPDVDTVICLGVHKQIEYNALSHRTMLAPLWVSKASAVQRAGRTGRMRPGTVYRLYARELFEAKMEAFDSGEMSRQPLDAMILRLRAMLHTAVSAAQPLGEQLWREACTCVENARLRRDFAPLPSPHEHRFGYI